MQQFASYELFDGCRERTEKKDLNKFDKKDMDRLSMSTMHLP